MSAGLPPNKSNLKEKASKALSTVKNNPTVQKAGQKIAEQQIKSKATALATQIKNKVTKKDDQFELPPVNGADGVPEVAVYNINETRVGSLASSMNTV